MNRTVLLDYYKKGHSLKQCAEKFGCSKQAVHQAIRRIAPHLMRAPYVHRVSSDDRLTHGRVRA